MYIFKIVSIESLLEARCFVLELQETPRQEIIQGCALLEECWPWIQDPL